MNGFIEKIKLKNFKCHDYLEFQFHPYINFILGRNGSNYKVLKYDKLRIISNHNFNLGGKSAIMDAVILALGGRTAATGRAANIKTFIKNNSE
jgi:chromosome segregation ATPase